MLALTSHLLNEQKPSTFYPLHSFTTVIRQTLTYVQERDKTTPPCMITVSSTNCTSTFHDLLLPRVLCLKPFRNASHHNNSYLVRVGSPVFFRSGSLRSPIIEINYNSILCPTKERIALSGVTIALLLRISCKRNKPQERQKERERERERERGRRNVVRSFYHISFLSILLSNIYAM